MGEQRAIDDSERPATVSSLVADLGRLGVEDGMTVMVHSSLRSLGWVAGGAQAVVDALLAAIGPTGTLMMPTHSSSLSDPALWVAPPVPESWWEPIRTETPAYDPRLTPTRAMGAIVECFRDLPGVIRSAHPMVSAAAFGPHAQTLVSEHALDHGLGEGSPQARLYDLDGHVLLLGVGHATNTSLHLSEYRWADGAPPMIIQSSPVLVGGERRWVSYADIDEDDSDFDRIGEAFAVTGLQRTGQIGAGEALLMRSRDIVDFATGWMRRHRGRGDHDDSSIRPPIVGVNPQAST